MKNNKSAFTLVELLVVIAIIGLLASISVIALQSARAKARDAKRIADVKQVTTALELFFNDVGRYPTSTDFVGGALVHGTTTYMSVIPFAPNPPDGTCDSDTNQFSYTQTEAGASYTVSFCTGGPVAALPAGTLCATPGGFMTCGSGGSGGGFVCGDQITIASIGSHTCNTGAPDYDACVYNTVAIGPQCWMQESMNVGEITVVTNNQNDYLSGLQKYCYGEDENNCQNEGAIYQWHSVMAFAQACDLDPSLSGCEVTGDVQGICPAGWHVPSEINWNDLMTYLGGAATAGGKMKEAGTTHWLTTNSSVDNSSGFTALGAGSSVGYFHYRTEAVGFWSTGVNGGVYPWSYTLRDFEPLADHVDRYGWEGFSLRCIRD